MKRLTLAAAGAVAMSFAGYAIAGVVVTGDSGGSVSPGQVLTVSVSDTLSGSAPGGPPYGWCDPSAANVAVGSAYAIGPLGPAEGGSGWIPLTVSCSDAGQGSLTGTWTYTGSTVVTVPQDAPATGAWVSVAVHERVPVQLASDTGCDCYSSNDYNFNQTYPIATTPTATTTTAASTTAPATTTAVTTTSPATTGTTIQTTTTTTTPKAPKLTLPDRRRTPGAANRAVTQTTIYETICVPRWLARARPPASFVSALKLEQMKQYGEKGNPGAYEEDHLIPLELGGAPRSPKNLWPEPRTQSRRSDPLEVALKRKVCAGSLPLAAARMQIVSYKRLHG